MSEKTEKPSGERNLEVEDDIHRGCKEKLEREGNATS